MQPAQHAEVDMTLEIEIVLRERNYAVTERVTLESVPDDPGEGGWDDSDVEQILKEILLAVDRVRNPASGRGYVALRGFSWIVEPTDDGRVVIAIEIPSGAAVAGPFRVDQRDLDRAITRVLAAAAPVKTVVH
jgi:hypothetical protein